MNLHQALNIFDSYYGKKRKKIGFISGGNHIYVRIIYNENYDKSEVVMFKLWLKVIPADYIKMLKPQYELILYKDNIYTNQHIMTDPEDRKHFFETLDKMNDCLADYKINHWDITLSEKMVRKLYHINRKSISRLTEKLIKFNYFNHRHTKDDDDRYWYNHAIHELPDLIVVEQYLTQLITDMNITESAGGGTP